MKIGEKVKVVFGLNEIPCTIVRICDDGSVDIKRDDDGRIINFESQSIKNN